jgi:hypothetical protein
VQLLASQKALSLAQSELQQQRARAAELKIERDALERELLAAEEDYEREAKSHDDKLLTVVAQCEKLRAELVRAQQQQAQTQAQTQAESRQLRDDNEALREKLKQAQAEAQAQAAASASQPGLQSAGFGAGAGAGAGAVAISGIAEAKHKAALAQARAELARVTQLWQAASEQAASADANAAAAEEKQRLQAAECDRLREEVSWCAPHSCLTSCVLVCAAPRAGRPRAGGSVRVRVSCPQRERGPARPDRIAGGSTRRGTRGARTPPHRAG